MDETAWHCPDTAGGIISWDNNDQGVYYLDTNEVGSEVVNVYEVAPGFDLGNIVSPVRTDGDYLTWYEYRGDWDHDSNAATDLLDVYVIAVHDISTGETFVVPSQNWDYNNDLCFPRISDGIVAFIAVEYGVENPDGDKELFYCDVTAATPELMRVTDDAEGEGIWDTKPEVADGLIVWRTGGSSSWMWRGKTPAAAQIY